MLHYNIEEKKKRNLKKQKQTKYKQLPQQIVPVISSAMSNSYLFQLNDSMDLLNEECCLILSTPIYN